MKKEDTTEPTWDCFQNKIKEDALRRNAHNQKMNFISANIAKLKKEITGIEKEQKQQENVLKNMNLECIHLNSELQLQEMMAETYRKENANLQSTIEKEKEEADIQAKKGRERLENFIQFANRSWEELVNENSEQNMATYKLHLTQKEKEEVEVMKLRGEIRALRMIINFQKKTLEDVREFITSLKNLNCDV